MFGYDYSNVFINIVTIDVFRLHSYLRNLCNTFHFLRNITIHQNVLCIKKKISSVACMIFSYTQDLLPKATINLVSAFFEISLWFYSSLKMGLAFNAKNNTLIGNLRHALSKQVDKLSSHGQSLYLKSIQYLVRKRWTCKVNSHIF